MNKFYKNFSSQSLMAYPNVDPSGMPQLNSYGVTNDTIYDPRFKVTSKKPYLGEVVSRSTVWDYWRVQLALPNESEILKKLGQNIEAVDELLCDARVKAALNNRRAGIGSLQWTLDQGKSPARPYKLMQRIFEQFPISDIISEMMMACFYGYNVTEVVWEVKDGLILPTNLTGKAQRWFMYSDTNELRYKTKASMVQGEALPPRKFIVTRYHPRYDDPYAGREALFNACYWPVKFRRIIMQWAMQFMEKYGMPWLDVTMEGGLQQDRLTEIVQTIQQTYQDGIIAHPDNTKIVQMNMDDSKSIDNYTNWLDTLNREIDMSILGTNLTTEVKGGSFAAANAHMGVRDDIIQEDIRMVEASLNQLIEWIAWYNFPADMDLPKFKLYKSEPPTKERAEIDTMTVAMGVKLKKEYFARTYGYNEEEFDLVEPQASTVAIGGEEVNVKKSSDGSLNIGAEDAKVIQDAGIEAKDAASNTQSKEAVVRSQSKGSYAESTAKISAANIPGSKLLSTLSDGYKVYQVDGAYIRDNIMTEFMGGANPAEEPKMASDEYWIEQLPHEDDGREIFAHEVIECLRMKLGDSYDDAHNYANSVEALLRGNKKETNLSERGVAEANDFLNFGGAGSGNFDHEGRPGEVGGSGGGGGSIEEHRSELDKSSNEKNALRYTITDPVLRAEKEKELDEKIQGHLQALQSAGELTSIGAMNIARLSIQKDGMPNNKSTIDAIHTANRAINEKGLKDIPEKNMLIRISTKFGISKILENRELIGSWKIGDWPKAASELRLSTGAHPFLLKEIQSQRYLGPNPNR